jgi:hypothetical protein
MRRKIFSFAQVFTVVFAEYHAKAAENAAET